MVECENRIWNNLEVLSANRPGIEATVITISTIYGLRGAETLATIKPLGDGMTQA